MKHGHMLDPITLSRIEFIYNSRYVMKNDELSSRDCLPGM